VSALIKPRLLAPMLAVVACFALAGPIIATASASDRSIIGVVNHWSPIVVKDEKNIAKAEHGFKQNRKTAPVVASISAEVSDLRAFAKQLKGQSASSGRGGAGRDDVAAGATLIANSYAMFASELRRSGSLTQAQINANKKIEQAGHKKIVAGITLLQKIA
jgi:hypothetical protein